MALSWWLFGLLAIRTIVDIPWAKACFVIGQFACWLAGKEAVSRDTHNSQAGSDIGIPGAVGNAVQLLVGGHGWPLAT